MKKPRFVGPILRKKIHPKIYIVSLTVFPLFCVCYWLGGDNQSYFRNILNKIVLALINFSRAQLFKPKKVINNRTHFLSRSVLLQYQCLTSTQAQYFLCFNKKNSKNLYQKNQNYKEVIKNRRQKWRKSSLKRNIIATHKPKQ